MIAYIHTEKRGIYCFLYRGKVKINGKWVDSINYARLPINLKPGESTSEIYTRTAEDFETSFQADSVPNKFYLFKIKIYVKLIFDAWNNRGAISGKPWWKSL